MTLTPFSVRVRDALTTRFPELAHLIRPAADQRYMEMRIPHRLRRFDLFLTTERDEVSIFFDKDHMHVGFGSNASQDEKITEAVRLLAGLIAGSIPLVRDTRWDQWSFYHAELAGYDPDEKITFCAWRDLQI